MLSLRKPSADTIRRFLNAQVASEFTYSSVGATATHPPAGFLVVHTRIKLGEGKKIFQIGRAGVERWEQFNLGWLEAWSPNCKFGQAKSWRWLPVLSACGGSMPVGSSMSLMRWSRSNGSDLLTAHCPTMRRAAKNDLWSNGTKRTTVCGTTSYRSHEQGTFGPTWLSDVPPQADAVSPGVGSGDAAGCSCKQDTAARMIQPRTASRGPGRPFCVGPFVQQLSQLSFNLQVWAANCC